MLSDSVPFNQDLRGRRSTRRSELVEQPTTRTSLLRLGDTFDIAQPLARWVVPAQTNCNYWNYWFSFVPNALSDQDQVGYTFRQALTNYPLGDTTVEPARSAARGDYARARPRRRWPATRASSPTARSARRVAARRQRQLRRRRVRPVQAPDRLRARRTAPPARTSPAQDFDDCQAGQNGYPLGRLPPAGPGRRRTPRSPRPTYPAHAARRRSSGDQDSEPRPA